MPGFPVLHQLPELAQTQLHWVGDAIQPSHPLLSPSPSCLQSFPASGYFQMSQFFTSGGQSIGVSASASVLPMKIQDWFPLGLTGLISFWSKGLSRIFSNTTVQKDQFFYAQPSLWSKSHIHTWLLEKTIASIDYKDLCQQSNVYLLIRLPMTSMLLNPMDTFECSFYLYQCGTQHRSWICLPSLWRNFMKYSWYMIQGFH